jgi:hypothetical protein
VEYEHALDPLRRKDSLQECHFPFNLGHYSRPDGRQGALHLAQGNHFVGPIEQQVDLKAGFVLRARTEVRPQAKSIPEKPRISAIRYAKGGIQDPAHLETLHSLGLAVGRPPPITSVQET